VQLARNVIWDEPVRVSHQTTLSLGCGENGVDTAEEVENLEMACQSEGILLDIIDVLQLLA
jgi:hypothetical protein